MTGSLLDSLGGDTASHFPLEVWSRVLHFLRSDGEERKRLEGSVMLREEGCPAEWMRTRDLALSLHRFHQARKHFIRYELIDA